MKLKNEQKNDLSQCKLTRQTHNQGYEIMVIS